MDIAIVAPAPVPYVIGGAENLWRGLQDFVNEETAHQAEIFKLPSREHSFWELIATYRRFAELDLAGFDLVVSTKYPAWMVRHDRHVAYVQHKLRGLYDTYHFTQLPERPGGPADLLAFMEANAGRRGALPEFFARMESLRGSVDDRFPGPLIRAIVHWLDAIGMAGVTRFGAISQTVRGRDGYFPAGADVFVVHHPTGMRGLGEGRDRGYLFTASRLDNSKRVDLIVQAVAGTGVELVIAGTGPDEQKLRDAAGPNVRFTGRVPERELAALYRDARAVAFVPYEEDYGLITLEAMLCGKPVITVHDGGGTTELVQDAVNGRVVDASPEALREAILALWSDRRGRRRMGRAALERASAVRWDTLLAELVA